MASNDKVPVYVTGTGQTLLDTHPQSADCERYGCPIHSPSQHHMRDWPTHWRGDRQLMERICPHGVGHPDPDHIGWVRRTRGEGTALVESVHGCCGASLAESCCESPD